MVDDSSTSTRPAEVASSSATDVNQVEQAAAATPQRTANGQEDERPRLKSVVASAKLNAGSSRQQVATNKAGERQRKRAARQQARWRQHLAKRGWATVKTEKEEDVPMEVVGEKAKAALPHPSRAAPPPPPQARPDATSEEAQG